MREPVTIVNLTSLLSWCGLFLFVASRAAEIRSDIFMVFFFFLTFPCFSIVRMKYVHAALCFYFTSGIYAL